MFLCTKLQLKSEKCVVRCVLICFLRLKSANVTSLALFTFIQEQTVFLSQSPDAVSPEQITSVGELGVQISSLYHQR